MANEEHLQILKQGVKVWNNWREENPDVRPDLLEANLIGAELNNANLSKANLRDADLIGANLHGAVLIDSDLSGSCLQNATLHNANLHRADLRLAKLRGANFELADLSRAKLNLNDLYGAVLIDSDLSNTDIRWADFSHADLRNANLNRAFLSWVIFRWTDLSNVNFNLATIQYTSFISVDLRPVKGLKTLKHFSPSMISIDTITMSEGNISEIFLRGAGVPDNFITYFNSLTGDSIKFYSCFISYSSIDQIFAERLYADLQAKGVRCWFAPEDIKIGDKIRLRIDESIRMYDKLLLILSETSVQSQWIEQEVETALAKERKKPFKTVLFPIMLDDAIKELEDGWPGLIKNTRHIGDFSNWKEHDSYRKAFDRLLRDLKAKK